MIENNKLYQDLTKTYTRPVEKIVKFFITSAAFAAILISISIVFTLLTEAINFFQDPAVTFKEYFTSTRWTPTFKNPDICPPRMPTQPRRRACGGAQGAERLLLLHVRRRIRRRQQEEV